MLYLKLRNGRLKIGPADERGEEEIDEAIRLLKQRGLSAIEVEMDYHPGRHGHDDNYHHQNYPDRQRRQGPYSPTDYTPQHYQLPMAVPVYFGNMERGRNARPWDDYPDGDQYQRQPENPRRPTPTSTQDDPKKAP
jgi:hypothetical protein